MAEVDPAGFLHLVRGWIVDPTPLDDEAMRRPELAVVLSATLRHLLTETNDRIRDIEARPHPDPKLIRGQRKFRDLVGFQKALCDERTRLLYPEADTSLKLRAQAKNELAQQRRVEYLQILRRLQAERDEARQQRRRGR